ncbi:MAG: epoxyqueuosine reductase [Candidatus Hydrothermarchaeota archaeon]
MNSDDIKKYARNIGADLVGIADLKNVEGIKTIPENLLDGYSRAISVGVRYSNGILDGIVDGPTPLYAFNHKTLNDFLDKITLQLSSFVQERGYRALPIPASLILDTENFFSNVSHKAIARAAGLGWLGKSLLLINPEIGPRFRLASLLTDMPLEPDEPMKNRCGECEECVNACPAGAIRGLSWEDIPPSREDVLDFPRCRDLLTKEFKNMPHIGFPICGVCVKVCPWGK